MLDVPIPRLAHQGTCARHLRLHLRILREDTSTIANPRYTAGIARKERRHQVLTLPRTTDRRPCSKMEKYGIPDMRKHIPPTQHLARQHVMRLTTPIPLHPHRSHDDPRADSPTTRKPALSRPSHVIMIAFRLQTLPRQRSHTPRAHAQRHRNLEISTTRAIPRSRRRKTKTNTRRRLEAK